MDYNVNDDRVTFYQIEYNPVSKTWCLYRYNILYEQRIYRPIFQSKDKEEVERKLNEIVKKKGKKVNERTI